MNDDTTLGFFLGFIVGCMVAIVVGCLAEYQGQRAVHRSAIRAGVGKYVLDKDGKVDFRWVRQFEKEETQ